MAANFLIRITPAKTIVDMFRHAQRHKVWYGLQTSLTGAVFSMKEALRKRKATPAEIARPSIP